MPERVQVPEPLLVSEPVVVPMMLETLPLPAPVRVSPNVAPVIVPVLVRFSVPVPALVRLLAVVPLEMTPPSVRVLPLTVMVRVVPAVVPNEITPVPMFKLRVPVKVKSPFQVWALLLLSVIEAPVVLSMVPPLMVNVPVPSAVALLILNVVPLANVVPPL